MHPQTRDALQVHGHCRPGLNRLPDQPRQEQCSRQHQDQHVRSRLSAAVETIKLGITLIDGQIDKDWSIREVEKQKRLQRNGFQTGLGSGRVAVRARCRK
jgi:hypothetical protein